ncbi:NPCBM/NEW2 domain-containing protein [Umezawaea sp. Da 62-37]|uniref:NPCBM/NEW2 domain-containing protein n=1 Tax=Umezawaea sp. Da 62-37 TaxID=3075927 RepID=UPI0028F6D18C|nr:NPCBM/NEW2 domain-containing protein [Umezawaea sp. Da 62-37]WNV87913.1 hypothetical protein RM788_06405 [Umezawaea sp. Da 62-37]
MAIVASAGHLWVYRDVPLCRVGGAALVALIVGIAAVSITFTRITLTPSVDRTLDDGGTSRSDTPGPTNPSKPSVGSQSPTTGQPTTTASKSGPGDTSLLSLTPLDEAYSHLPVAVNGTLYTQAKVAKPFANYVGDFAYVEEYTVRPIASAVLRAKVGVSDDAPTGASVIFTITIDGQPSVTKVVARGTLDNIEADISGQTRFGIRVANESDEPVLAAWIDPVIVDGVS